MNIDTNKHIRKNKIISYKIIPNINKNKSYNNEKLNNNFFEPSKNNDENNNNKMPKEYKIFFSKYENIKINEFYMRFSCIGFAFYYPSQLPSAAQGRREYGGNSEIMRTFPFNPKNAANGSADYN